MKLKKESVTNKWFFTELPPIFKLFHFYVRGDLLVLLPLVVLIVILSFFSVKFAILMAGVYITVRQFGEVIYWFSQQFHERIYRPYDFGLKNLDNHAIYILYQTTAIAGTVFGLGAIFWVLLYMK